MKEILLNLTLFLVLISCGGGGATAATSGGASSSSPSGYNVPGNVQPVEAE